MNIRLPAPLWLLRWLTRRNPWLLAERGAVARSRRLNLGPLGIEVETSLTLSEQNKARLSKTAPAR